MKPAISRLFKAATSLKLTIACLAAAMVLVFAGTMAQIDADTHDVQVRYFQSWLVWWRPFGADGTRIPVFPGGHLLGAVLVVNLLLVQIFRFPRRWRAAGLHLTHFGILVILVGSLFTDLFSIESNMAVGEGETTNYSVDIHRMELAVIDVSDPQSDRVTAIPATRLKPGAAIEHSSLPFRIKVLRWMPNSQITALAEGEKPASTRGIGAQAHVKELPHTTAPNQRDMPSAIIEILPAAALGRKSSGKSAGTWLVSPLLGRPQPFRMAGRQWTIALRPTRYYTPYSITLLDFTHERYPGTGIPKNFSSKIRLVDPDHSVDREALIYMNHPLRYGGNTYYQASYGANDTVSILLVVRNPSFIAPYIGCVITGAGMLLLFGMHLTKFLRRQTKPA